MRILSPAGTQYTGPPVYDLVQDLVGPGVTPHDGGVQRLTAQPVPHYRRLTLVGNTCTVHMIDS